jgi:hypothetical protein
LRVHENVIDLDRTPSQGDHSGHTYGQDPRVDVAQLGIQKRGCGISLLADAETDAVPTPCARFLFGRERELSSDTAASPLWQDENVLDLRKAQVCPGPRNVRVPDRLISVPRDEVGRALFDLLTETVERQASIDVGDLAWLQFSYRDHVRKCHTV